MLHLVKNPTPTECEIIIRLVEHDGKWYVVQSVCVDGEPNGGVFLARFEGEDAEEKAFTVAIATADVLGVALGT